MQGQKKAKARNRHARSRWQQQRQEGIYRDMFIRNTKSFAFQTTCTYYTSHTSSKHILTLFFYKSSLQKSSLPYGSLRASSLHKKERSAAKNTDSPTSRKRNPSKRARSGISDSRIRVEHHQLHLRECLVPARVCDSGFSQLAASQRCSSSSVRLIMLELILPMSQAWESRCIHLQSGSLHFNKA